ncbi:MAG: hypothetical protein Fur0040_02200 [Sideroxydans sp.]
MLPPEQGRLLPPLARAAIAERLGLPAHAPERAPWMNKSAATFVTLQQQGRLRGCIGSLEARRPLLEDVRHNALAAAFGDPRFPPLQAEELPHTDIEVSVLSPATPLDFYDERDALAQLRPHVDGLILQWGDHRATFLPQVWDDLPAPQTFLDHLKRKAGLDENFWSDDLRLSRYTVQKFGEEA